MQGIELLRNKIRECDNIVFFGGAGVSTESGIPDFRGGEGIYSSPHLYRYPPEEILSREFFNKHTDEFYKFYKDKMVYLGAKPNLCHFALADLENRGKLRAVVTQNIDGLHQAAGSKNVLELHGSISRNFCKRCGKLFSLEELLDILKDSSVPYCEHCEGVIKPDVVLYQESLNQTVIKKSVEAIADAELLIVAGTSLTVYPAAGMIDYFDGQCLVIINRYATSFDNEADIVIHDTAGKVMEYVTQP